MLRLALNSESSCFSLLRAGTAAHSIKSGFQWVCVCVYSCVHACACLCVCSPQQNQYVSLLASSQPESPAYGWNRARLRFSFLVFRPGPGTRLWDLSCSSQILNTVQLPPDPTHHHLFIAQENRWKQQAEMSFSLVLVRRPVIQMLEERRLRESLVSPRPLWAQGLDTQIWGQPLACHCLPPSSPLSSNTHRDT